MLFSQTILPSPSPTESKSLFFTSVSLLLPRIQGHRYYLSKFHESESEVTQSCPTLCDLWTVAHQAPPPRGFSRQEYWSGLPFPSPGDLPDPGIEPRSPTLQADALTSAPPGKPLNTRIQSRRKPPIETQNFRSKY